MTREQLEGPGLAVIKHKTICAHRLFGQNLHRIHRYACYRILHIAYVYVFYFFFMGPIFIIYELPQIHKLKDDAIVGVDIQTIENEEVAFDHDVFAHQVVVNLLLFCL